MTDPTAIPDEFPPAFDARSLTAMNERLQTLASEFAAGARLYILDGAGQATEVRRPAFRGSSQAGLAAVRHRLGPALDLLPPGLADQIERAAAECVATAPEGEVVYAGCWCDDDTHTPADLIGWRESADRARRDRDESAHPAHLIRRITVTEAVA